MDYKLTSEELEKNFMIAKKSARKRFLITFHQKGDYKNRIMNFLINMTYIQPHMHNSAEKKEKVTILSGKVVLLIFNNIGQIKKDIVLEYDKTKSSDNTKIVIPPHTYHTYLVLSKTAHLLEEMNGCYNPNTWKKVPNWAPAENSSKSKVYIKSLYEYFFKKKQNLN